VQIKIAIVAFFCVSGFGQEAGPKAGVQPVRIVFFRPSDLSIPAGVQQRITSIANYAESFFEQGMTRNGYAPAVKKLFRREENGEVEVLFVQGEHTAASGKYAKPDYAAAVADQAGRQYQLPQDTKIFWIFIYLGDRPVRFQDWAGLGDARRGGWAMINYDTVAGEIRQDLHMTEGFNFEYKLKSTIHELAHALGLPHMGPDPTLGLGNSLMGPNPPGYATRNYPNADRVYLSTSEAAMLWKHPLFSGVPMGPAQDPKVKLADYRATYDAASGVVTISAKVSAGQRPHSAVVIDNRGDNDPYWSRTYAARVAADGTFQIRINDPAKANGCYLILFCFENGMVSGDGAHFAFDNRGEIRKGYTFRDGAFQFEE
jgi:hypothetical protein